MKRLVNIIIMFCLCSHVNAQVISGFVYDKATNQPVSDVYVYLDGTSINTITDASGKFELKAKSVINTKLVLSRLSYYTVIIDRPFEGLPDTMYLKERENVLKEVTILADCFTRKQKMMAFRKYFLGTTKAGSSCTIQNEEDIQLSFDMQNKILSASSEKPIIVNNEYLGYQVSFTLVNFEVEFPTVADDCKGGLRDKYVRRTFFSVVSSFTDQYPNDKKIKRNRNEIYRQSSYYFFKNFVNNTLKKGGFKMLDENNIKIDHLQYFVVSDTLSQKMISIIPEKKKSSEEGILASIYTSYRSSYNRNNWTGIHFLADSLLVDQYGYFDINKITFSGAMAYNRAGDMLPIDYEP